MNANEEKMLLDTCVLAGKILMENGAEMHRVEDTMNRILSVEYGTNEAMSFVIPTGIFVTTHKGESTKMKRISSRKQDVEKIAQVNEASRQFSSGIYDVPQFYNRMQEISTSVTDFPLWLRVIVSGVISACMMIIFQGSAKDFGLTFVIGALGYAFYYMANRYLKVRFLQEFLAAFLVATVANVCAKVGIIHNVDTVIIGSIIIFVPGIQIMNSIRDFLVGNTISGTIFLVEAMMIAAMIGAGVMSGVVF
ncbi:threonine/serine exporter family protein [Erysipelothrix aquatica]|uniref:threonine/serine exporter family protein n=1 Tax=Erysipelothrix aquatica TaxID=2683714 RepID=UPI001359AFE6|nr:threonine/serine exporter family protein [Erysipelothrix aquatica]